MLCKRLKKSSVPVSHGENIALIAVVIIERNVDDDIAIY